ncbi:hypothetical protein C1925_13670 [Stenotrophomonas sp. SAU14A_NAIMI4_5]|nr:hypothetical protein C1925_13670 [Stenotrophomonas sp. SAU14A_NAIMI4_5]
MRFDFNSKNSIPIEIHPRMAWIYWPGPDPRLISISDRCADQRSAPTNSRRCQQPREPVEGGALWVCGDAVNPQCPAIPRNAALAFEVDVAVD